MMKRLFALISLVFAAAVASLPTATADDYVDDVYFFSAQKQAAKSAKRQKVADAAASSAKPQTASAPAAASSKPAAAKQEKVRFVQVSDTVVKAVIRR